jgi:hypothetical protein
MVRNFEAISDSQHTKNLLADLSNVFSPNTFLITCNITSVAIKSIKSSLAILCVNDRLKTNVPETSSVSIIRVDDR